MRLFALIMSVAWGFLGIVQLTFNLEGNDHASLMSLVFLVLAELKKSVSND